MQHSHHPWLLLALCAFAAPAAAAGQPDLDLVYVSKVGVRAYDAPPERARFYRYGGRGLGAAVGAAAGAMAPARPIAGWYRSRARPYVTWMAKVRNRGSVATGRYGYRWSIDGAAVKSGVASSIPAGATRYLWFRTSYRPFQQITVEVDPGNKVAEVSEGNNKRAFRSNALMVGFWVEKSVRDFFDQHQLAYVKQFKLGDGANSFEDWAQRQIAKWNDLLAKAVYPSAKKGGRDRIRLQKVIVVPDGALPLNGGIPTNHPDTRDKRVDMMWGFRGPIDPGFHDRTRGDSAFNIEWSLLHELQHARFLVDAYGLNVHGHQIEVTNGEGKRIFKDTHDLVRRGSSQGIMNGGRTFSEWSINWLNVYAYRRPLRGWANFNAHLGLSEYMRLRGMRMPAENVLQVVDSQGAPLVGAKVLVYQAKPRPGAIYDKVIDDVADKQGTTDAKGGLLVGKNPFGIELEKLNGGTFYAGVVFMRILHQGREHHAWLDLAQVHVAYFRGARKAAAHQVVVGGP